jgi:hypothetical protein
MQENLFYPRGRAILGQYALSSDRMGGKAPEPACFVAVAVCVAGMALRFVWTVTLPNEAKSMSRYFSS